MAVIGLDLGGTKLAAAVLTTSGRIVHEKIVPLGGRNGEAVGTLIKEELAALLGLARKRRIGIAGIGVSVPGISYSRTGRVWVPNIAGWENYQLRRELESVLGKGNRIPVVLDSDRACYILGETWIGAAKGCCNAIFLAVGTGIGAGILADGKILRGASDIAGCIGWLALDRPYRNEYVGCGCFEYHASGEGLAKVAIEISKQQGRKLGRSRASALRSESSSTPITARDVLMAHARGDPVAAAVVNEAIEFWGMAVANLVSLFNPEKIIFGGGVFGPASRFLGEIYAEAKKWAQPVGIKQVKLIASKLGGAAGLYGAASLALPAGKRR